MKKIKSVVLNGTISSMLYLRLEHKVESLVGEGDSQLMKLLKEKGITIDDSFKTQKITLSNLHFKGTQIRLHSHELSDSGAFMVYKSRLGEVYLCKYALIRYFGFIPKQIFFKIGD